jgi:2-polyprenyl-3-methyl-5-hydroxy-6-metoxy-1,4-benzoquinol methylase
MPQFIQTCPIGCESILNPTSTILPEGPVLRCSNCGQWISQCTEERYWQSMQEFNDPRGTLPDARSQARAFRRHQKFLRQVVTLLRRRPSEVRLLDVGCSSGAFLGSAIQLGFLAQGVEPAPKAAQTAQASGLKVFQGLLHEAHFDAGQFDAITLLEVIEHLREPLPLLQESVRLLRPGGVMLIGTANTDSWQATAFGKNWDYLQIERHGGHVSFFNPRSLALLASTVGLQVAAVRTRGLRFSDPQTRRQPWLFVEKIAAELLTPLAQALDKGCDMAVYLRKV